MPRGRISVLQDRIIATRSARTARASYLCDGIRGSTRNGAIIFGINVMQAGIRMMSIYTGMRLAIRTLKRLD